MGTVNDPELLDLRTLISERSWVSSKRFELSEASETALRTLRKKARGTTEVNNSQMDGRHTAIRPTPTSKIV
jgi:hypothetical protein